MLANYMKQSNLTLNSFRLDQRQLYLVGPLPFGIVRQSLVEALRELGWSARPLHALPAARNVTGVMWKVQSTSVPPKSVLALKDGEAVNHSF